MSLRRLMRLLPCGEMANRALRPPAAVIGLLLVLAACGDGGAGDGGAGGSSDGSAAAGESAAASDDSSVASGEHPLAITAETVGGDEFDGSAYTDRDVLLWFWAPW